MNFDHDFELENVQVGNVLVNKGAGIGAELRLTFADEGAVLRFKFEGGNWWKLD
jgi:hypothetical protein